MVKENGIVREIALKLERTVAAVYRRQRPRDFL
jgi:hypothetical protein